MLHKKVKEFIGEIEGEAYVDIPRKGIALKMLIHEANYNRTFSDEKAELYALNFKPKKNPRDNSYKFEPIGQYSDSAAHIREFPSREDVDAKMLRYWKARVGETTSLILRLRYLDLLADFMNPQTHGADWSRVLSDFISTARRAIRRSTNYTQTTSLIERAVYFAGKIRNTSDKEYFVKELVRLSGDCNRYSYFAFDFLVSHRNLRDQMTERRKLLITRRYRRYVELFLSDAGRSDRLYDFTDKAYKLAYYYADINKTQDCEDVMLLIERFWRNDAYSNSSSILRQHYLNELIQQYGGLTKFFFAKLKKRNIQNEIVQVSTSVIDAMQRQDISIEITPQMKLQIEELYEYIFPQPYSANDIDETIQKIIWNSLPDSNGTTPSSGLMNFVSSYTVNNDGLQIYNEDSEQPINHDYMLSLRVSSIFLAGYIEKLLESYILVDVVGAIFRGSFFRQDDKNQVKMALEAYIERKYIITSSLLIPIIESTIRDIHQGLGTTVIQENRYGGFDYHADLGSYINNQLILDIYSSTLRQEDIKTYFSAVLTSRYGWNVRNDFAHGINKSNLFSKNIAASLVNIILCLSIIRLVPVTDTRAQGAPTGSF